MNERVYFHIGLPKTATTSLQFDYFPYVDNEKFLYLGVTQPRGKYENDSLYDLIFKAIYSGRGIKKASQSIYERIEKEKKSLIISDEIFTVSIGDISWRKKVKRIGELVKPLNYRILVTVREPASAMHSFYIERYQKFRNESKAFVDLALSKEDFEIYKYEEFFKYLDLNFEKKNVYCQAFENILIGDFDRVSDFLGYPEMESGYSSIKNRNIKNRSSDKVSVPVNFNLNWIPWLYRSIGGERNVVARFVKSYFNPFFQKLRRTSFRSVEVPTLKAQDSNFIKEKLTGDIKELSERFGVKY